MQEQFPINPSPKRRRALGYLTRTYRDFITGGDTGLTLLKAGIVITIAVVGGTVTAFALPIIVAGAIVGSIYVASSIKDEYDRNKAEDQKILELAELNKEVSAIKGMVNTSIPQENFTNLNNSQLLKVLLRDYLQQLGLLQDRNNDYFRATLKSKRKKNGYLPGQEGMVRLIESVTGFKRSDPLFAAKVSKFLTEDSPEKRAPGLILDEYFTSRLCEALNLGDPDTDEPIILHPAPKVKGKFNRFKRFLKNSLFGVQRGTTALSLVIGSSVLLGAIVLGVAVAWPIIVVGAVLAILSGGASLIYSRYVEKSYKLNNKNLDEQIKAEKTHYDLLYKLNRLSEKTYDEPHISHLEEGLNDPLDENPHLQLASAQDPRISAGTRLRMRVDTIAQTLYGVSVGMVIGVAITSVALILLTIVLPPVGITIAGAALAFTAAGAVGGGLLSMRYGFMFGKGAFKASNAEAEKIQQVADQKENCVKRLGKEGEAIVNAQLMKSKQQLVAELLDAYTNYVKRPLNPSYSNFFRNPGRAEEVLRASEVLEKKERILRQIEEVTGIKRPRNTGTGLPDNQDPGFYNKLSYYLQEDKKTKSAANNTVSQFKSAVLGGDQIVDQKGPSWRPTWSGVKSTLTLGNKWSWKHVVPLLGALGIAFPLGFILFGPAAVIPIAIVAATILTIVVVHKVCEYKANKNLERLAETEAKLPLIESIVKTQDKTIKPQIALESDVFTPVATRAGNEFRRSNSLSKNEEREPLLSNERNYQFQNLSDRDGSFTSTHEERESTRIVKEASERIGGGTVVDPTNVSPNLKRMGSRPAHPERLASSYQIGGKLKPSPRSYNSFSFKKTNEKEESFKDPMQTTEKKGEAPPASKTTLV